MKVWTHVHWPLSKRKSNRTTPKTEVEIFLRQCGRWDKGGRRHGGGRSEGSLLEGCITMKSMVLIMVVEKDLYGIKSMVLIMCGQALWIMSLKRDVQNYHWLLPAFSFKTKEGRASKGRAEVARMGPRKTSPINWNLCIFFILKQPDNTSGGIPWVSPATVTHQTLRYNKPEAKNKFDILSQWLLGLFSKKSKFSSFEDLEPRELHQ